MKKLVTVIILVFLVGCLACGATLLTLETSRCDVTTLVLDVKEMPQGWYPAISIGVLGPDMLRHEYKAKDAIATAMEKSPQHFAGHRIYRYANSWWAKFFYWFYKPYFPANYSKLLDFEEANNLSLHADQITIRCYYDEVMEEKSCVTNLRYGSDISNFSSEVGEGIMSFDEFQEIILKIDSHFVSCMN